jgi:hypothetical protein
LKNRHYGWWTENTSNSDHIGLYEFIMDWKPVDTAPFDRDVELAVINGDGKHALTFPCRRAIGGWVNAVTEKELHFILPTHWRVWVA